MKISNLKWSLTKQNNFEGEQPNTLLTAYTEIGRFTVLNRLTGFGNWDTETGYADNNDGWWLVSGGFDIREYPELSVEQAAEKIKELSK